VAFGSLGSLRWLPRLIPSIIDTGVKVISQSKSDAERDEKRSRALETDLCQILHGSPGLRNDLSEFSSTDSNMLLVCIVCMNMQKKETIEQSGWYNMQAYAMFAHKHLHSLETNNPRARWRRFKSPRLERIFQHRLEHAPCLYRLYEHAKEGNDRAKRMMDTSRVWNQVWNKTEKYPELERIVGWACFLFRISELMY